MFDMASHGMLVLRHECAFVMCAPYHPRKEIFMHARARIAAKMH